MVIQKGDFVLIDYTGTTNNKVFDTTSEQTAKEKKIHTQNKIYKPIVVSAGNGDVIKGLDKEILLMEKNQEKTITITPEDGYGQRDQKLIRVIPLTAFTKNKMNPFPGMHVELDGMTARIQSVNGGRVRVDFNHELAGRTLEFQIKITEVYTKKEDKIKALTNQYFNKNDLAIEIHDNKIKATPSQEILKTKEYGRAKAYLITQITNRFPETSIEFIEEYKKNQ